ncbi:hypothetical protein CARUB_v10027576mg [Capsella rubella]|uniref:GRF-type domain-containing protein n=1 Tax=Capsella rubella TaxID=81985 RepID=R0GMI6_9BRAS|nr:hypothetical protein CARUB_v10027576mg [Capsella rubella]
MEKQRRGFLTRCRCGESVVLQTSGTSKNRGRLFHVCPFRKEGDWTHAFKWTDMSMVEELKDLTDKVDIIDGASMRLHKGLKACESEIDVLTIGLQELL